MPPPTPYSAVRVWVSRTTVRIATLKFERGSPDPGGARYPIAPQYGPRAESSRSAMILVVRTFGAPVTDPLGNRARNVSSSVISGRRSPSIVEVSCQTVSKRSASSIRSTSTEPVRQMRPRSLRSRSTIIAFSARSFEDATRRAAISSSSAGQRPRGAVPFIGFVVISLPSIRKNSSGDAESTRKRPRSRNAAYPPRCARQRSR